MSIRSHTLRPVFFSEKSSMYVDTESEMIGDEILSGGTNIERVEVGEFSFESVGFLETDGGVGVFERSVGEDVVPNFISHIGSVDSERSDDTTIDRRAYTTNGLEYVSVGEWTVSASP